MDLTSPVTGMAITGLTSPTYSIDVDTAPTSNGKQWYVSALGGTQAGVSANSIGFPFTVSLFRPAAIKLYNAAVAAIVGMAPSAPKNVNKIITRKGVLINAVGGMSMLNITTTFEVPVGAPEFDNNSIKAAISNHAGVITQDPDQWSDAITSGGL